VSGPVGGLVYDLVYDEWMGFVLEQVVFVVVLGDVLVGVVVVDVVGVPIGVGVNWWEVDCDLMVYVEVLVLCAVVW